MSAHLQLACDRVIDWASQCATRGWFPIPTLAEAEATAKRAGWMESTDGWRCPSCSGLRR